MESEDSMSEIARAQGLACLAALVHLGFIADGALGLGAAQRLPVARLYAALSGTEGPYGFFAPWVAPELRASFRLTDEAGQETSDTLERGSTPEAHRRFKNLVTKLWLATDPAATKVFARSFARGMFQRHPSATRVTVELEAFDLPTMEAYRRGARPSFRLRGSQTYTRRAKPVRRASEPRDPS
jgi:hypothetical protein